MTDDIGNSKEESLAITVVNELKDKANVLAKDSNKIDTTANTNLAHQQTLKNIPTKCPFTKEVYSNITIVAVLSVDHQRLTMTDGTVLVLQLCTTQVFAPTVKERDFRVGSKVVFAGVPSPTDPNRFQATKILKLRDP